MASTVWLYRLMARLVGMRFIAGTSVLAAAQGRERERASGSQEPASITVRQHAGWMAQPPPGV